MPDKTRRLTIQHMVNYHTREQSTHGLSRHKETRKAKLGPLRKKQKLTLPLGKNAIQHPASGSTGSRPDNCEKHVFTSLFLQPSRLKRVRTYTYTWAASQPRHQTPTSRRCEEKERTRQDTLFPRENKQEQKYNTLRFKTKQPLRLKSAGGGVNRRACGCFRHTHVSCIPRPGNLDLARPTNPPPPPPPPPRQHLLYPFRLPFSKKEVHRRRTGRGREGTTGSNLVHDHRRRAIDILVGSRGRFPPRPPAPHSQIVRAGRHLYQKKNEQSRADAGLASLKRVPHQLCTENEGRESATFREIASIPSRTTLQAAPREPRPSYGDGVSPSSAAWASAAAAARAAKADVGLPSAAGEVAAFAACSFSRWGLPTRPPPPPPPTAPPRPTAPARGCAPPDFRPARCLVAPGTW